MGYPELAWPKLLAVFRVFNVFLLIIFLCMLLYFL